jgi:hypothetical protein
MAGLLIIFQKEVKCCPYVTFLGKVFGTEETRNTDKIFVDSLDCSRETSLEE